jgi:serine/threonine protein kinase/WD40 repeat protein
MNGRKDRVEAIFQAAMELNSPQEREAYLLRACGEDTELRREVAELLRAAAEAEEVFESRPQQPALEQAGSRIGQYRLLQKIGEGGCGIVHLAEQEAPVRRKVALKIVKLGMDTRQVIARFEAERQALALMDHPNIAKVLDAGATETGRPYFVMELVQGAEITKYCDEQKLSMEQRLNLFIQVCQAVQHAHQKGVIHRDLKPSNILVTERDGVPVPKVIDFGIAKATGDLQLTDKTLFTAFEQFLGTPAYMSPEQARLGELDIDTRSDIYSLGVLLYELLTGQPPFEAAELKRLAIDEVLKTVREKNPPLPSSRLTAMTKAQRTTVARCRQVDPAVLPKILSGDLDWIVMKALEKDRRRRYDTVNGLAMDIERHLRDEPVIARPPSAAYRVGKFVQRNRLVVAAAVAVLGIMALGALVSTWQAVRATRAQREQRRLREEAENARTREASQRTIAQQRLYDSLVREARVTRIARRLGYRNEVFKLLQQARDLEVPNKNLSELRREAEACLGDFVGQAPKTFTEFTTNAPMTRTQLDPSGRLAAFGLADGTILLQEIPSGNEVARLRGRWPTRSLCFSPASDRLISIHRPGGSDLRDQVLSAAAFVWTRATDGNWNQSQEVPLAGATECLSTDKELYFAVADYASHSMKLLEVGTGAAIGPFDFPKQMSLPPAVALSPNGQMLAIETVEPSASEIALVDIWDLHTGQRRQRLAPRLARLVGLTFTPDGSYLACRAPSGVVVYGKNPFEPVAEFSDYFGPAARISFAPNSTIIALPLPQVNRIRLCDWSRKETVAWLEEPSGTLGSIEAMFGSDGSFLLTAGYHYARFYRFNRTDEKLEFPGHTVSAPGAAFSPDGSQLASVSKDRSLRIWDAETSRLLWERGPLPGMGQFVGYSPDGQLMVTSHEDTGMVCIWDPHTGEQLLQLGTNSNQDVCSAQFGSDSRHITTASTGSGIWAEVVVWKLEPTTSGRTDARFEAKLVKKVQAGWRNLLCAPDGRHVAYVFPTSWETGQLYVWDDFSADAPPRLLTTDIEENIQMGSFSPDSRYLYLIDTNRAILTLDVETGRKVASFPTLEQPQNWSRTMRLCLSPDGTKLALTSPSYLGVDIWDSRTGRLLYSLPEQVGSANWLAWDAKSQRLAVSRSNGNIAIWNLKAVEQALADLRLNP